MLETKLQHNAVQLALMNCVILLATFLLAGCSTISPGGQGFGAPENLEVPSLAGKRLVASNDRNWSPDLAVLPYAEFAGEQVVVRNVRNCAYESDKDYVVNYHDKQFDLGKIRNVDFIVVPFKDAPSLAHTMISFGFADGQHLAVSAEARLEIDEQYSPLLGQLRQYELMYVVADERDAILRRTMYRGVDVFVYRTVATPEQSRELFLDVMQRVNKLAETPEFYDTLTNNCTTNIVGHLDRLRPGRIPYDPRVLLPGYSDGLAFELGLIDSELPFAETRRRARVTDVANAAANSADFSTRIRR